MGKVKRTIDVLRSTDGSFRLPEAGAQLQLGDPAGDAGPQRDIHSERTPTGKLDAHPPPGQFAALDHLVDRLDLGRVVQLAKRLAAFLLIKLLASGYVTTESDGRVHLQSFGLGVLFACAAMVIQPFLMNYFETWILILGKLTKHLAAWCGFAIFVMYVVNHGRNATARGTSTTGTDRVDTYEKLEYKVTNSKPSSPKKLRFVKLEHRDEPALQPSPKRDVYEKLTFANATAPLAAPPVPPPRPRPKEKPVDKNYEDFINANRKTVHKLARDI